MTAERLAVSCTGIFYYYYYDTDDDGQVDWAGFGEELAGVRVPRAPRRGTFGERQNVLTARKSSLASPRGTLIRMCAKMGGGSASSLIALRVLDVTCAMYKRKVACLGQRARIAS